MNKTIHNKKLINQISSHNYTSNNNIFIILVKTKNSKVKVCEIDTVTYTADESVNWNNLSRELMVNPHQEPYMHNPWTQTTVW